MDVDNWEELWMDYCTKLKYVYKGLTRDGGRWRRYDDYDDDDESAQTVYLGMIGQMVNDVLERILKEAFVELLR
jgi:hypothetical protein